jgi:hypothetical protein
LSSKGKDLIEFLDADCIIVLFDMVFVILKPQLTVKAFKTFYPESF